MMAAVTRAFEGIHGGLNQQDGTFCVEGILHGVASVSGSGVSDACTDFRLWVLVAIFNGNLF